MLGKKTIIVFFIFKLVLVNILPAQVNLVIDGGFEALKHPLVDASCIEFIDVKEWRKPNTGQPYYYNLLSTYTMCNPNYNHIYYQIPKEGNGMVQLMTSKQGFPDIGRTYVQGSLTEPLVKGKAYEVKFYVSLSNYFGMSTSKIGALLTTDAITFTYRCEQEPQVESNRQLTDTMNWMEIKGEFIAQGGEKYITLGNFRTDAESDTLKVITPNELTNAARTGMYVVDDVSVICLDCTVGINEQAQRKKVTFNNSTNTLNVSERGTLVIYNMQGAKVLEQNIKQEENIHLQELTKSVYVWQLRTEKSVQRGKFVVRE